MLRLPTSSPYYQRGVVQLPVLAAIWTSLVAIASWLATAWTAAWSAIVTYSTVRFAVGVIISLAWLAAFVAFLTAAHALLPTATVTQAQSSLQSHSIFSEHFLPWLSYLKPAGFSSYIAAISATWVSAKIWQTYWVVLDIRRTS